MMSITVSAILAGSSTPGPLPRSTPEAENVDPAGILAFVNELEKENLETHSFMLLRNGKVIAEGWWRPCSAKDKHTLYSLSKSFMSTAAGLAINEGKLSLDDPVSTFFPDDMPAKVTDNLAEMKVKHLLTMTCGQETEPMQQMFSAPDGNFVKAFLSHPVPYKPGTHFLYNTAGSYMVSAIVQKATGKTLTQILEPTVYKALGIKGVYWDQSPAGVDFGGFGLHASTEDIAKFGQLYLNGGVWNGERILPRGWVEEATKKQVQNGDDPNNDWNQGYGYQFWRCRHGAYRGDGAFGQFCVVMPGQNAVLAITGGGGDMGKSLSVVWEKLLPAFDRRPTPAPDLAKKLRGLELPYPKGKAASKTAAEVDGKVYRDAEGKKVSFEFKGAVAVLSSPFGTLNIGLRSWKPSPSNMIENRPQTVMARGAWTSDDTFEAKILNPASTWSVVLRAKFQGNRLTVAQRVSGVFGPSELPTFEGKL